MRNTRTSRAAVALIAVLSLAAAWNGGPTRAEEGTAGSDKKEPTWSYRADVEGLRPVARSFDLSTTAPEDLVEDVAYQGSVQRYAQLRYGSENSRRVVVVVDELDDGAYVFYVDANRDRRIAPRDLVPGAGRLRTCEFKTEIVRGDYLEHEERQVQLRLGVTRTRLSAATLGCIEGRIPPVASLPQDLCGRRIDGNANGLFADARDRLLIDLDANGTWDPISEQFAYLPVLTLHDRRFAVRSDRLGRRLTLSEITGVGHLRVDMNLPKDARITDFEAMIFADDGSAYSLRRPDSPLTVPVGRYALGSVTMTIDTGEHEPWHFVFSRSGSVGKDDWNSVAADQDVTLKAVGQTRFVLNVDGGSDVRPGDSLTVKPRLYTQDGLLINFSCRGEETSRFDSARFHNRCDIKLTAASGGGTLNSAQSGFS